MTIDAIKATMRAPGDAYACASNITAALWSIPANEVGRELNGRDAVMVLISPDYQRAMLALDPIEAAIERELRTLEVPAC